MMNNSFQNWLLNGDKWVIALHKLLLKEKFAIENLWKFTPSKNVLSTRKDSLVSNLWCFKMPLIASYIFSWGLIWKILKFNQEGSNYAQRELDHLGMGIPRQKSIWFIPVRWGKETDLKPSLLKERSVIQIMISGVHDQLMSEKFTTTSVSAISAA
jgi:hypothetical protein